MFGIGMTEIVVILVVALLIFGPNKLPELARSLGRGFGEFRRASYDLRQSLMEVGEEPPHQAQGPTIAKPPAPPQTPPEARASTESAESAGTAGSAEPAAPAPKDDPGPPARGGSEPA